MSANNQTHIPPTVYDALRRGWITPLMFLILALLHSWADYNSGMVRSVSAERILYALGNQDADKRTIQRAMKSLRETGWFLWDYIKGHKRPYNVTLTNYTTNRKSGFVADSATDSDSDSDADTIVLNSCEIKDYRETPATLDVDIDADSVVHPCTSMSPTNQIVPAALPSSAVVAGARKAAQGGQNSKDPKVEDLSALTYALTGRVPPSTKSVKRLLAQHDFDELKGAMTEYFENNDDMRAFFSDIGAASVITARRKRKSNWK